MFVVRRKAPRALLYMILSEQPLDEGVMMNDRRRVSTHDGGRLLLWTILLCCCNTVACDTSRQLEKFGMWYGKNFKELQAVGSRNSVPRLGYCDLDIDCDWEWTEVFKKVKAARTSASKAFPSTDASNSSSGTTIFDRCFSFQEKLT